MKILKQVQDDGKILKHTPRVFPTLREGAIQDDRNTSLVPASHIILVPNSYILYDTHEHTGGMRKWTIGIIAETGDSEDQQEDEEEEIEWREISIGFVHKKSIYKNKC